ncbi:ATP-binding protein [Actinomadura macra]|uniref:ATP-binding protein n=1 Tax=Actinomadura macra TaxID=46164 RepID=UPI001470DD3A|nr:ATP-binding protein [Actinomadura macra]
MASYGEVRPPGPDAVSARQGPRFIATDPLHTFDKLLLTREIEERLLDCIAFVEVAPLVFDTWGLRAIEPHPSVAVNFRGPPGTGKTMAAHAAASRLGKKILLSRLSELESKYHGDGPKNIVALFDSAKEQDAIVFIDEAESLLSRRFAQPEQAAESAINSMRTELLMALDAFDGLAIFASNLPHSYDTAMESRLLNIEFTLPDLPTRRRIWEAHLVPGLPVDPELSIDRLASIDGVSGRDIKLSVITAAIGAARRKTVVTEALLVSALERQRRPPSAEQGEAGPPLDPQTAEAVKSRLRGSAKNDPAPPDGPAPSDIS